MEEAGVRGQIKGHAGVEYKVEGGVFSPQK